MKSSRLPDKVMLDLAGKPMLVRVIERVQASQTGEQGDGSYHQWRG